MRKPNLILKNTSIRTEKKLVEKEKRRHINANCRIIHNLRSSIYNVLKHESKTSSTMDKIGVDVELYRLCIEFQMTPELYWTNIDIEHLKPISSFDMSKDKELRKL